MGYQPIENYGIIGDLHKVALVGMDGSIDFMCAPRFDSPSIFAAVLDDERGGRFRLAPLLEDARQKQLYLPDTCVLLTRFLSHDGVAEVSDFMPIEDGRQAHDVVRRAKTVRGEVRFRMVCQPRFDYARATHTVEQTADGVRFVAAGGRSPFSSAPRSRCASWTGRRWRSSRCAPTSRRPSSSSRRSQSASRRREQPTTSPRRSRTRSTSGAAG